MAGENPAASAIAFRNVFVMSALPFPRNTIAKTPAAKRRQAAALVKAGVTVSLAHNPLTERADDNASPFEHTKLRGNNMDRYAVAYHGYAHSQIEALCHI